MTGQKQTGIHQIYCVRLFWNMPLSVRIKTLLIDRGPAFGLLSLLAPTGALIVTVVYYISAAAASF